ADDAPACGAAGPRACAGAGSRSSGGRRPPHRSGCRGSPDPLSCRRGRRPSQRRCKRRDGGGRPRPSRCRYRRRGRRAAIPDAPCRCAASPAPGGGGRILAGRTAAGSGPTSNGGALALLRLRAASEDGTIVFRLRSAASFRPMTDALGFRKKFGVIAPSTNTSVQPEFEAMRPRGVTNHFGRIHIPNDPIRNDDDFNQLMENIRKQMLQAVDDVMTCEPDYLIMGMSSETFWDGLEGSKQLHQRVEARAGVKVSMGSDAARAALQRHGAKRIGVITPHMPVGDAQGRRFSDDCGFEVVRPKGLKCGSPVLIAHGPERELRDAILEVNGPDVDAVIQVGTNLAMARLAGIAEFWLDKPVLAINTCIYWWSLRQNGIDDKIEGFGSLLLEH